MIVKNLTKSVQYLWIKNLLTGRSTSVRVLPEEPRAIGAEYIPDRSKCTNFDQIFKIENGKPVVEVIDDAKVAEETVEKVDELSDETISTEVEVSEEPVKTLEETVETAEDKFICDICGVELGSARGLNNHKKKVHIENN